MNDLPKQTPDDYAAMSEAGFYYINEDFVGHAFSCALGSFFGNIIPSPPQQYVNLVAPFRDYLSILFTGQVTQDELLVFLKKTETERHQIIFNFARKDFGEWFNGHPVLPCTTRADTLWSLYRLVNDLKWYTNLRMWECHVLSRNSIERLSTIQSACTRFSHPLTELPKVLPAIAAKNITYLEDCIDLLLGEAAATYQHFCIDESMQEPTPDAGTLPKPETTDYEARTITLLSAIYEKVDSIAQDQTATRMELSQVCKELHSCTGDENKAKVPGVEKKKTIAEILGAKVWHDLDATCSLDGLTWKRNGIRRSVSRTWKDMGIHKAKKLIIILIELAQSQNDGIYNPGTTSHRKNVERLNGKLVADVGIVGNPVLNEGKVRVKSLFKLFWSEGEIKLESGSYESRHDDTKEDDYD